MLFIRFDGGGFKARSFAIAFGLSARAARKEEGGGVYVLSHAGGVTPKSIEKTKKAHGRGTTIERK